MRFLKLILIPLMLILTLDGYSQEESVELAYSMDFVFSGEVKNYVDSVFLLEYTFDKTAFSNFKSLFIENSKGEKIVVLNNKLSEKDMEVKHSNKSSKISFRNYDKLDIPIPVAVDVKGKKKQLYYRAKNGKSQTGKNLVEEVKRIRQKSR